MVKPPSFSDLLITLSLVTASTVTLVSVVLKSYTVVPVQALPATSVITPEPMLVVYFVKLANPLVGVMMTLLPSITTWLLVTSTVTVAAPLPASGVNTMLPVPLATFSLYVITIEPTGGNSSTTAGFSLLSTGVKVLATGATVSTFWTPPKLLRSVTLTMGLPTTSVRSPATRPRTMSAPVTPLLGLAVTLYTVSDTRVTLPERMVPLLTLKLLSAGAWLSASEKVTVKTTLPLVTSEVMLSVTEATEGASVSARCTSLLDKSKSESGLPATSVMPLALSFK